MKKLVVKLDLHDDKAKKKALMTVSRVSGIVSLSVDMKEKKLTVVGDADPVAVVSKLRKFWNTEIETVGPTKEPEKKKDEGKKDEKKDDNDQIAELVRAYEAYNPRRTAFYLVESAEEKPNFCVIC